MTCEVTEISKQTYMAHQEIEGWPLGLRPLNERLIMDLSVGSISFNTLLTASPTNSSISSSDLDTQSTASFFLDKSKTLGSLIGVSNILDVSRRRTTPETPRMSSLKPTKPWLFSLCSKLTTDAVIATNNNRNNKTPSLAHFLQAERRAVSTSRANQTRSHVRYAPNLNMNSNSLFVNGLVAPNPSSASGVSTNEPKSNSQLLLPLLFPRLCGQLIKC